MVDTANIRLLDSGEPYSQQFQDFYFSTDGGFSESEYVFLKQNNLPQRFVSSASNIKSIAPFFKILETGFGTGLNFLVSAYHHHCIKKTKHPLQYISIEKYPLTKSQLIQIYTTFALNWPKLTFICEEFLKDYPESFFDFKKRIYEFDLFNGDIKLKLIIDDAASALQQLKFNHLESFDVCYLDGFSPAKNPDMWQQELFNHLEKLTKVDGTLSTFTSAGFVRRGLEAAGFNITKVPGLGKKREILTGIKKTNDVQDIP